MQYKFSQFEEPGSLILQEPKAIVCFSRDDGTPAGNHISNCFLGLWSIKKQCVLSAQRPSNFQIVIKLNAHLVHPQWRTTLESSPNACGRNRTGHWPEDVPEPAQLYSPGFRLKLPLQKVPRGNVWLCASQSQNGRAAALIIPEFPKLPTYFQRYV